jgi:hypothetical protein
MRQTYILSAFLCLCLLLQGRVLLAQSAKDTTSNKALFTTVEDNFYTAIGPQSRLYSGTDYQGYDPTINGNAYFLDTASFKTGWLVYDGYLYKNVPLLYDINADQLITKEYQSGLKIQLIKNRIASFNLLGHHFINLTPNASNPNSLYNGFYDVLYNGRIQVLAKREKSLQMVNTSNHESYFSASLDYFIYKNNAYYPVKSQGSFISVLKDKKSDLQHYIRTNRLKFNKQGREGAMAKVAAYYDQITN